MTDASRDRVRPWLKNTAILVLVLLAPFAAHAIWDLVEARRLSAAIEAIRARGEKVYWTDWVARIPTPEEKRTGRYYTAAALLAREAFSTNLREINETIAAIATSSPRAAARDPRLDQIQRVLDGYAPMLDLLDRANALASGDIRSGDELRSPVPDQNLANVNALRIARLSFLGDSQAATSALVATLKLRNVSSFWPVGVNTNPSLRLLLMYAPPDAQVLSALQQRYSEIVDEQRVEHDLLESRARLITAVWPAAPGPMIVVPRVRGISGRTSPLIEVILRPWLTGEIRRRILEFDEALPISREPWPKRLDLALALAHKYPVPPLNEGSTVFGSLVPSMAYRRRMNIGAFEVGTSATRAANEAVRQRVALTVLAIERFRRANGAALPTSIDALVPQFLGSVPIDPFTGAALKFMHNAQGYRVYSVGMNRTDDGGDWSNEAVRYAAAPAAVPSLVPKDIGIDIRKF